MKLLKENFGYIYKITNTINNKIYIGKTKETIDSRYKRHIYDIEHHKTKSLLYDAMKKYGIDSFKVEQIDVADTLEDLNEKEKFYIKNLNSTNPAIGYNINKGGDGGHGGPMFKGHHHSEETRKQMSISRMGDKNSNYGNHRIMPDEEKHKHACPGELNGMYGKKHSEESKVKNRLAHIGSKRMTNNEIYPKYKVIKINEIQTYLDNGWYFLK